MVEMCHGDEPSAGKLVEEQDSDIELERPIIKDSKIREPEDLTPDQIELIHHLTEDANRHESIIKSGVIEDYKSVQQELDDFLGARKFLMENGNSAEIAKQRGWIENDIKVRERKIQETQKELNNAGWFSAGYKRKLNAEKAALEKEIVGLQDKITKLDDKLPSIKRAERDFGGKNELTLKNRVREAKLEAEKY